MKNKIRMIKNTEEYQKTFILLEMWSYSAVMFN